MQAGPPPAEELQRVLVTVAVGLGLLGLLAGYVQYKSRMMISRSSARRQAEAGEALGRAGGTAGPAVESRPVRDIMKQPALPKVWCAEGRNGRHTDLLRSGLWLTCEHYLASGVIIQV